MVPIILKSYLVGDHFHLITYHLLKVKALEDKD
jgi:hypothetical protein